MPDPARLKNPMKGRYVLLDSIQDPGNIGTIIRTAAAAEVKGILLTKGCTDAYSDKAVRSSMGSILRILRKYFTGVSAGSEEIRDIIHWDCIKKCAAL